jgi:hypothetical protein
MVRSEPVIYFRRGGHFSLCPSVFSFWPSFLLDRSKPPSIFVYFRRLLGRAFLALSSLASTANRMTRTESLFGETINDFCNKIGTGLLCGVSAFTESFGR